jgi:hypothetical protein
MNDGAAGTTGTIKARSGPLVFIARRRRPLRRRAITSKTSILRTQHPEASMPMTTTMPTFDQRVERALQNLCAHEPGTLSSRNISAPHVTRIYGKASTPVLRRTRRRPHPSETIRRHVRYYDGNLSLRQNRCFSVAGAVAEIAMRSNRNGEDDTTEQLNSSEIWDCMSSSDPEPFSLGPERRLRRTRSA